MGTFGNVVREGCPVCVGADLDRRVWAIPFGTIDPPVTVHGAVTPVAPILVDDPTVYEWSRCRSCTSIVLDPCDGGCKAAYRESRYHAERADKADQAVRDGYAGQYGAWIGRYLKGSEKSLLDGGCGAGDYLKLARERGGAKWERLVGLELSRHSVAYVQSRGFDAYVADLDAPGELARIGLPAASFDFVVLSEVLEHTDRPRVVLENLWSRVAVGGRFFFTMQAIDGKLPIRPAEPIYASVAGLDSLLSLLVEGEVVKRVVESGRWKVVMEKRT